MLFLYICLHVAGCLLRVATKTPLWFDGEDTLFISVVPTLFPKPKTSQRAASYLTFIDIQSKHDMVYNISGT